MQMFTGRKYRPRNEEEYLTLEERAKAGVKFLEGKWFDEKYKRERAHCQEMLMSLYLWDLDHGIIEKGVEQLRKTSVT